jgi:hypothetical protein
MTRKAVLRGKIDTALGAMRGAAAAAILKGDPLAEQFEALATSIAALAEIFEASADTQMDIATMLRTASDAAAQEAVAKVHASGVTIIDQLAPRLVAVVEKTARSRQQTFQLRTILSGAAMLVAALALAGGFAYATGFASGRAQGASAAHTISAALAAGPAAAAAWAPLMADNDPVQALAACQKAVATDPHGRRYCAMPVWLDPSPAPGP